MTRATGRWRCSTRAWHCSAVAPGQARQAYELLAESWRLREGPGRGLGRTLLHLGDAAAALGDDEGPWALGGRGGHLRGGRGRRWSAGRRRPAGR
ncbi:hypothetical protein ENC19_09400 [Verrucosispora sp. CWR15]|uniref:Uncharacterized protein n=1 Tax=Verrucosispora sioxanthis TaxID=2499994 RepID=A0A6M1KVN4_9ACTN|nr:hypothetical protein [Verrucosispora sioxanthis]NGM12856.1 hypothetical protein [Verrucosispora sioxanthis]